MKRMKKEKAFNFFRAPREMLALQRVMVCPIMAWLGVDDDVNMGVKNSCYHVVSYARGGGGGGEDASTGVSRRAQKEKMFVRRG